MPVVLTLLLLLVPWPARAAELASNDYGSSTNCTTDGLTAVGCTEGTNCHCDSTGVTDDGLEVQGASFGSNMEERDMFTDTSSAVWHRFCVQFTNFSGAGVDTNQFWAGLKDSTTVIGGFQANLNVGSPAHMVCSCTGDSNAGSTTIVSGTWYEVVIAADPSVHTLSIELDGSAECSCDGSSSSTNHDGYRIDAGVIFSGNDFDIFVDDYEAHDADPANSSCTGEAPSRRVIVTEAPSLPDMIRAAFSLEAN